MDDRLHKLKEKIFKSWNSAEYGTFGQILEQGVLDFASRRKVSSDTTVLDVACGTGNCAIPLAQLGAQVTGVDIAPTLLEIARARSEALGLHITFKEGDAEALPYANNDFDLVTSSFGVVFAPRQELAARELVRVCKPGGTIALMAWTDASIIGQLFGIQTRYAPLPPNLPPNTLWGSPSIVQTYFGATVTDLRCTMRTLPLTFATDTTGVVEFFRHHSRALRNTFRKLGEAEQAALQRDLEALWNEHNIADSDAITVEADYLEIVATKAITNR